jgi:transposase
MGQTLTMSKKERDRMAVLVRLGNQELSPSEAASMLGMSSRQLFRVKARWTADGDAGLVHQLRGKSSNRGYAPALRQTVLDLYREHYRDYGPRLFSEMLSEYHQITLSAETLRQWLIREGLWERQQRRRRHRRKRPRRAQIGELVQFDGSVHDWFEGRGASCTLLVAIDDASSRTFMRFVRSENSQDVMATLQLYIERYGIPRALYIDGSSVFFNDSGKPTDAAVALAELGVELIRARSPQAKGRVERSNRTHQDRLIKALRRAGINDIDAANAFLETVYIQEHNQRFSRSEGLVDVHRSSQGIDLERIFSFRCRRSVNSDWTVRLNSQYLQLGASEAALPPVGSKVELRKFLDGTIHAYWQDQELVLTVFQEKPQDLPRQIRPPKADHPWKRHGGLGRRSNGKSARQRVREQLQLKQASGAVP